MNIESIAEVKVLTQGYQAEYGRSSGLQITAVTKSGTNQFRGSGYDVFTNSDWNDEQLGQRRRTATPSRQTKQQHLRLHHRRPGRQAGRQQQAVLLLRARVPAADAPRSTAATPIRLPRADGARARRATSRRRRDNNGAPDPAADRTITTGQPFPDNMIPANRLYAPGLAVLNRYPLPNVDAGAGDELQLRGPCADRTIS